MKKKQPPLIILRHNPVKDHPIEECKATATKKVTEGWTFYQKWTCEKCGSREVQKTPNVFFPFGECKCGHVTDIGARGCNYALMRPL